MYKINENSSSKPMVEGCHACDNAEYLYFHDDSWHMDEDTNINYCPQCGVLLQIPIVIMERNPVWNVSTYLGHVDIYELL